MNDKIPSACVLGTNKSTGVLHHDGLGAAGQMLLDSEMFDTMFDLLARALGVVADLVVLRDSARWTLGTAEILLPEPGLCVPEKANHVP